MRWLVLFLAACATPPDRGPPCAVAAGHTYELAQGDIARSHVEAATRAALEAQLRTLRDDVERACTTGAWSIAVRTCMAAAPDSPALAACETELTEAQRRVIDRIARGKTDEP